MDSSEAGDEGGSNGSATLRLVGAEINNQGDPTQLDDPAPRRFCFAFGNSPQNWKRRLDLIPPEVAEQNRLPASQIVYVTPNDTPRDSSQKRQVNLSCAKPVEPKTPSRPTILYRETAKYTEIARINRLEGTVSLSVVFNTSGQITDIRMIRGLPDGLTRRAIHAVRQICSEPATIDSMPVNMRGDMELNFRLSPDRTAREL